MPQALVKCVPNISEGRDLGLVDRVADSIASTRGVLLLHRTSDVDHNRSVITFAAPPDTVVEAAVRGVAKSAELIDLNQQRGVHPRLGALDVLPFVPLAGATLAQCVDLAHAAGQRIWSELRIPVYFYEAAALRPERRKLEDVRRGQFEALRTLSLTDPERAPDIGGPGLHPTAGAVIAGARKMLVAYNINLHSTDLALAQRIARQIRERDGGFVGVKALGVPLKSREMVQVSMNVTDHEATPLHVIYTTVQELAAAHGVNVAESEIIGLAPRAALERAAADFLQWREYDPLRVLENKVDAVRGDG